MNDELDVNVIPEALPGETDETAERFEPSEMKGQLIEAEHLARYTFASSIVKGRRVLDAGCGWAYGSTLLAESGALEVVGIDVASTVIEAAADTTPENVELVVGNVLELPFEDATFDVVVCFEVIEHLEQREKALSEFARVLAPNGVLAISSPNREIYGDRNPFHFHEFAPDEFTEFLSDEFAYVELMAQQNWITSMVSTRGHFAAEQIDLESLRVRKIAGRPVGDETYLIALASRAPLTIPPETALMTFDTELKKWLELWEAQDAYLTDLRAEIERQRWDETSAMHIRFIESRTEIADVERRVATLQRDIEEMRSSLSWRVTRPLRENRILRRLIRR